MNNSVQLWQVMQFQHDEWTYHFFDNRDQANRFHKQFRRRAKLDSSIIIACHPMPATLFDIINCENPIFHSAEEK